MSQRADVLQENEKGGKVAGVDLQKVGYSLAYEVCHPMDTADHLEEATKFALDFNLRHPSHLVKLERRKNLLKAKLMAKQTELQEMALRKLLPPSLSNFWLGSD